MERLKQTLKSILRNEYVDINATIEHLANIAEETKKAGPAFENFRLACLNNLKHQHAIAIDYANRSLKYAVEMDDVFLLEHLHTLLGFIAYNRGDFETCITHYLKVLEYVQSPRVINNIGAIFDDLGDMYEAYRYYKQAEEVFDDPLNFRLLAIIYSNLGECETAFGHYDAAQQYLKLSQNQIQEHTGKEGTTYIFNSLGNLALLQNDFDTAIHYYAKGETFSKDESILVYYQKFMLNHAKVLLAKGAIKEAKSRVDHLIADSKSYHFDMDLPEVELLLAKIADAEGKLKNANHHYKQYIKLIDKRDETSRRHRSESIKTAIKLSDLHAQLNTFKTMSKSDALTGLGNRFALRDYMDKWQSINENHSAIIALFDIDHFKRHNDVYGHTHGDLCLQKVANILKAHLQTEQGGIFRYGGDEFLVALIGASTHAAEKQLEATRQSIELLNDATQVASQDASLDPVRISCSIGAVNISSNANLPFQELFDMADRALYISKDLGRNRVTVLSSQ